jgi:hypothetical protein
MLAGSTQDVINSHLYKYGVQIVRKLIFSLFVVLAPIMAVRYPRRNLTIPIRNDL